jgi:hypothetical protein
LSSYGLTHFGAVLALCMHNRKNFSGGKFRY